LLHVDTGFGGTLSLNGRFVAEHRLLDRLGNTLPTWLRGVGGRTEARVARIERFRLGDISIERPIATLALVQGAGVRAESSGRVGGEFLRRYTVTFDYAARMARLVSQPGVARAFDADMSGLTLREDQLGVEVIDVAAATPAEGRVRPGDRLLAIDGRPAASIRLDELRALLREHGATRLLRLRRGQDEFEVPLRLYRRI
jgi:hypothetical protein